MEKSSSSSKMCKHVFEISTCFIMFYTVLSTCKPSPVFVCAFEAYSTKEIDKLNEQRQRLANQSHAAQGKGETPAVFAHGCLIHHGRLRNVNVK